MCAGSVSLPKNHPGGIALSDWLCKAAEMPSELERIEALEREVASLKERVAINDADLQAMPNLFKVELKLTESRLARTLADFRAHVDQRFDATVRAVAEIVKDGK
jgi:hypothetical protein